MNLIENAGIVSRALFFWLTPMIMKGNRQSLDDSDLWELGDVFRCRHVIDQFNSTKGGLYTRLLKVVGRDLAFQISCGFGNAYIILITVTAILSFSGPYFLNRILTWIQCPDDSIMGPWNYLIALLVCSVAKAINDGQMV